MLGVSASQGQILVAESSSFLRGQGGRQHFLALDRHLGDVPLNEGLRDKAGVRGHFKGRGERVKLQLCWDLETRTAPLSLKCLQLRSILRRQSEVCSIGFSFAFGGHHRHRREIFWALSPFWRDRHWEDGHRQELGLLSLIEGGQKLFQALKCRC